MKNSFIKLLCLCTILSTLSNLQGEETSVQKLNDKIYVSPGSIYIAPDAIYLNINETFLLIDMVGKDENGIYAILNSDIRVGYCSQCKSSYSGSLHDHLKSCPARKR